MRYFTLDVFTDRVFGGNQLAVFPDAREIAPELMPQIAREFNFSETTFVLPPADRRHAARVRIFTPGGELQFAGHPTVGTAHLLASIGAVPLTGDRTEFIFEEGVGPVPLTVRSAGGKPTFAQLSVARLPEFGPPPPSIEALAEVLSLAASDFVGGDMMPQAVSCGTPFLFVPLRSRQAVGRARLNADAWQRHLENYFAPQLFFFALDPEREGSDVRARMFAPSMGIVEDPATGAAAVGLGGYLASRSPQRNGTLRWRVEQGFEMGRPSILDVEVDKKDDEIIAVRVGGNSVLVSEGDFTLP